MTRETNQNLKFPVVIEKRSYPFPFRTRQSSSSSPMILRGQLRGKVGRRRDILIGPRGYPPRAFRFLCTVRNLPSVHALITGGSGFLGQALVRELRIRGANVVSLSSHDADLRHSDALAQWSEERFDRIYHLAAWTQAGDFAISHPGEQWLINQQINTTVLRFWAETQPQALLFSMGTSCA